MIRKVGIILTAAALLMVLWQVLVQRGQWTWVWLIATTGMFTVGLIMMAFGSDKSPSPRR
jgi:hypothetical protein